jgi:regulator of sigma E protease
MGHFLVARWCGVRIEVFSIGFGPELFGWTDRHRTRWRISLVPLGGYVRMFGHGDNVIEGESGKPMSEEDLAVAFSQKSVWRRMAIVAAGPIANYAFALVILFGLFLVYGKVDASPIVGTIQTGSAADLAGIEPGDRIVRLNGERIESFTDIRRLVQFNLDQGLAIEVERNGQIVSLSAKPTIVTETDLLGKPMRIGRLGITSAGPGEPIVLSPRGAAKEAAVSVYETSADMLSGLWQMLVGVRPADELGGVLRIAAMSGEVAKASFWSLIGFCALLSINLGLINLFPIPMLDGGHLFYYALEALAGRPLSERVQEWGLRLGVMTLLALMVFATWNDLVYLNVVDYIRSLFT